MPKSTFVVAFDGEDQPVINAAIRFAKAQDAHLHVVHVLEWSPYSFLTPEELADRHKQRQSELTRAQSAVLEPVLAKLRDNGLSADGQVRHGNVVDIVSSIAANMKADMIFVGRSNTLSDRVFGSVASGLAQSAPVPVVIVP